MYYSDLFILIFFFADILIDCKCTQALKWINTSSCSNESNGSKYIYNQIATIRFTIVQFIYVWECL